MWLQSFLIVTWDLAPLLTLILSPFCDARFHRLSKTSRKGNLGFGL